MKKIKVAQIGTSNYSHGNLIWESLKRQPHLFEIAGYAMPENEEEKFPNKMPAFEGYRKMTVEEILQDPTITAVLVETEELFLTKYAILAAKSGKHVHMEKPGGQNPAEFEELIAIARETKKVLHVGYMYRYNPYVAELIKQAKNGELGEIISVEAQMNRIAPQTDEARQWLSCFKGGITFFLNCHLIDLIFQICGKPEDIIPFNCVSGIRGTDSEDFGMIVFKYKNGVSFAKTNAAEIGGYLRRQLVVAGTKKTVEIKPLEVNAGGYNIYSVKTEHFNPNQPGQPLTTKSDVFDRYGVVTEAFASYVRGEKENPYTLDYELELYKLILKACGIGDEG